MIAMGVNFGGPEQHKSAIDRLLSATMQAISAVRGAWLGTDDFGSCDARPESGPYFERGSAPAVNVVFYVPGSLLAYEDLKNIEAARFSRKDSLVLVAAPVPKDELESGGSVEFVIDTLHQANRIAAETFAHKKAGEFDLVKADAIVENVRQSLIAQGF